MVADPLQRTIDSVLFSDAEISRIWNLASREADAIVSRVGSASTQGILTDMARINLNAWRTTQQAVGVGIGDAVWSATEMGSLFDERMMKSAGVTPTWWRNSLMAQAGVGVQSIISRKENGITLSERVYKNTALSRGTINDIINSSLALGLGPKDIAQRVKGYMKPGVAGGVSYAAMRLGRTEVVNAFHTTAKNKYIETPWVNQVKWNLSGRHTRPDVCNDYADAVNGPGWDAGIWAPTQVPGKPHPNCLCFITPVPEDIDTFVKNFNNGKYDGYIEDTMGCMRSA